jgi:hypothetical protein
MGLLIPLFAVAGLLSRAEGAAYRDELTFIGRTTFLFREYALVVPLDLKRQPLPGKVFVEIKAWGAWNGSWRPYIYEPIDVPGVGPEDLNGIIARYREIKGDTSLDVREGGNNTFDLKYDGIQPGCPPDPGWQGRSSIPKGSGILMVRGWVEVAGSRSQVFGLNTHVQDE